MKVFISSTYKDLIDYRAAAIRAVEGTNYQASKMEVFGARPDEPLDACLKEVEESDFFLGIYAHRYGYVPAGSDISITEMEYVHARKLGKTIYCFVIDEENHPWLPKFIEGEPGASKLKDFKRRIQTDHVCAFFTSSDDLGMKVANALSHYVANHHETESPLSINHLSEKPRGSTLPRQSYFFGREKELQSIAEALAPDSRGWGAIISGPGGIGKTALAIKAAQVAPKEIFEHKFFITAKIRELTSEGEKPLTDFTRPNYLEILNELAMHLGEDGIPRLIPEERTKELWNALRGKKVLVVLDNLETLHEDERMRLYQFLSRLPEGNKAIVTSRRRVDAEARVLPLDRMEKKDALELILELAKTNPRLLSANEKERLTLYQITNGNPLLIMWISGQLGREESHCRTIFDAVKLMKSAPKDNDPLEFIFGDLVDNTLSDEETAVLAAISHFNKPSNAVWIAELADLTISATQTALEDLANRSIIVSDKENKLFSLPPLAALFIRNKRPAIVLKTGDRLANRVYALAMQNGFQNHERFFILNSEWTRIASALPSLIRGKNARLQRSCEALEIFLDFSGRWDEAIYLFREAEEKAVTVNDLSNASYRASNLASIYERRNQYDEAVACAKRASEYWENAKTGDRGKYTSTKLLGELYNLQGNSSAAIAAFKEARSTLITNSPESPAMVQILNMLAILLYNTGDYANSEIYYREALRIAKKNQDVQSIATITGNWATSMLDRELWHESEMLIRDALVLAETIGRYELIAALSKSLAIALGNQGQLTEALQLARRAVKIFTRLRYRGLSNAQEVLKACEAAISNKEAENSA